VFLQSGDEESLASHTEQFRGAALPDEMFSESAEERHTDEEHKWSP